MGPWKGRVNAEVYDRFVRDFRIYRQLNDRIVQLARVDTARSVLDLACGTGATALSCLRVLDVDGDLLGVDASEAMVEVARAHVIDPRARFEVTAAASVDRVVVEPFDRVVCNAAFWQFPATRPVLGAVSRVLRPGGLFAFNVPAERVRGEEAPVHPFQVALARAVERRTGDPFLQAATTLDPASLEPALAESGFSVETVERFAWRGAQGELMSLMEVPAMIEPMTPGLDERERAAVVEEARGRTDPSETVEVPWIYWLARRR